MGNTVLYLAHNCLDHPGSRITKGPLYQLYAGHGVLPYAGVSQRVSGVPLLPTSSHRLEHRQIFITPNFQ
jgi:hypothetical protein